MVLGTDTAARYPRSFKIPARDCPRRWAALDMREGTTFMMIHESTFLTMGRLRVCFELVVGTRNLRRVPSSSRPGCGVCCQPGEQPCAIRLPTLCLAWMPPWRREDWLRFGCKLVACGASSLS